MTSVWGQPTSHRYKVKFNKLGKPVGKNKSRFTEFLGTISRNGSYAPIDVQDWRKIDKSRKKDMLKIVKEKFDVPPSAKIWILRALGKYWRNWKAWIKATYYKPNIQVESQMLNLDVRVVKDQYKVIADYWELEDTKKISEKNKKARAMKTTNHNTGKKSFAQIRANMKKKLGRNPSRVEMFNHCYTDNKGNPSSSAVANIMLAMNEKVSQLPPETEDSVGKNDVFAQVVGQDKHGHVRMYGFGICPTDVWGDEPSRSGSQRLVLDQKHEILEMKAKFAQQEEQLKDQARELANLKAYLEQQNGHNFMNQSRITSTSSNHMSTSSSSLSPLKEGNWISLFSLNEPTKVVAVGRLQSLDPSTIVGGQPLGSNWCEVLVQVVIERDEHLIRPYVPLQTIADSFGAPIAWPTKLVKICED
ncbi:uncharacterized protein [Coffea arabica]|uniref:Transposase Tnp1/En/Spm-like domain-containing protein n=1 Tax=Coffea arabica TaxID=13443 RepID=A0ABM4X7W2_COFAR